MVSPWREIWDCEILWSVISQLFFEMEHRSKDFWVLHELYSAPYAQISIWCQISISMWSYYFLTPWIHPLAQTPSENTACEDVYSTFIVFDQVKYKQYLLSLPRIYV